MDSSRWQTIPKICSCRFNSTPREQKRSSTATKESTIVKRTLDLNKPSRLSVERKARLEAATALPDTKQQITLRLDADVLEFLKHTGKRYQSRINAVLRAYVEAHKSHAK